MVEPVHLGGDHSLAALAHGQIEAMILDGGFEPGERLVETQLAEMLGVSRGPIRQALQRLDHEGWVERRPRHGTYVRQRDREEAEDFFAVRHTLEVQAAGLAAANRTVEDIERLEACLTDAETLSQKILADGEPESEDARTFHREASIRFHKELVLAAHNSTLQEVLSLLVKQTRWYFSPGVLHRSHEAWDEHAALVEAIADQDMDKSRTLMDDHMERTLRVYLESLR